MFNNVGRTIKLLAKVLFGVGIGLSVLTWLICLCVGAAEQNLGLILGGVLVLIFGILGSWVNCILLYGFGSLVESNEITAENTAPELKPDEPFDSFR